MNGAVPHDLEAERSVLGTLLLSERAMYALILDEGLRAADFYLPAHRLVFTAMRGLFDDAKPFDRITVRAWLRDRGQFGEVGEVTLDALAEPVVATKAREYARIVRNAATQREVLVLADRLKQKVGEGMTRADLIAELERGTLEIAHEERSKSGRNIDVILADGLEKVVQRSKDEEPTGIKTGFVELDKVSGGLDRGSLTIIAARPAMGKTAFTTNIAEQVALGGYGVALFSMEMSEDELAQRILARRGKVRLDDVRRGTATREHLTALAEGAAGMDGVTFHVDDTAGLTITALRAKARQIAMRKKLDMIVVDYLQLMPSSPTAENRVQGIGEISMGLKILARELNVSVVALSQLSRNLEQRVDKHPVLSDLRDSGSLEQDADNVWALFRPHYYDRDEDVLLAELLRLKARQGEIGTSLFDFLGEWQHFRERVETHASTYASASSRDWLS